MIYRIEYIKGGVITCEWFESIQEITSRLVELQGRPDIRIRNSGRLEVGKTKKAFVEFLNKYCSYKE